MSQKLRVATSQFDIETSISKNLEAMKEHIVLASEKEAHIVHFPECCLSGYGGFDFVEILPETEAQIKKGISEIQQLAKQLQLWTIFGTHYFEGNQEKPYNCLFVINQNGEIETRYDKRLLSEYDLDWYSAGNIPGTFEIKGIKCGLLICHEWRYPELYRQCYHLGVQLLFQSWYDGNYTEDDYKTEGKNLGEVITGFVRGNAANNYLWISASNTSKKEQGFPAFVCRPDGSVNGKLTRNKSGLLLTEIDAHSGFMDLSKHLRDKVSRMKY